MRVAHMYDAWQITVAGKLEMLAKDGALHISRREHAKIIQPELTNRYNLWLSCHLAIMCAHLIAVGSSIMRVCPYPRKDNTWMRFRQRKRKSTRVEITTRINDAGNAPFESS